MIWTHLELAKEWKRRGNQTMVRAIAKSFFRLKKMQESQAAATVGSR